MKLVELSNLKEAAQKVCVPFKFDNLIYAYNTYLQLSEICDAAKAISLSSVQIGVSLPLFVARLADKKYRCFVNMRYQPLVNSTRVSSIESCLSIRDLSTYKIQRYDIVVVQGQELVVQSGEPQLKEYEERLDGVNAMIFQHEIDHQNNVLVSDIGEPINLW